MTQAELRARMEESRRSILVKMMTVENGTMGIVAESVGKSKPNCGWFSKWISAIREWRLQRKLVKTWSDPRDAPLAVAPVYATRRNA